jgi:hypothetical protein
MDDASLPSKPHPKAKFTAAEDMMLAKFVKRYGTTDWTDIARRMEGRNARQCRDRWVSYLSPDVQNAPWTAAEEQDLLFLHQQLGPKWKQIATFFTARTDINVKSRWNLIQRRILRTAKAEQTARRLLAIPNAVQSSQVPALTSGAPVQTEEYSDSWDTFPQGDDGDVLGIDRFWL